MATLSTILKRGAALGAVAGLVGCAAAGRVYEPNPQAALPQPIAPQARVAWVAPEPSDGSIWTDANQGWFGDNKAARPGDIILVNVVQRNTGAKNAKTDTSRSSSISAKIKYFLGFEKDINKLTDYEQPVGGAWDPNNLLEAESTNAFKGSGETNRTDSLTATVSAVVTDRLSNGNLVIYGHQTVTINNEASVLTVQGIVRPADVDRNNTIDSTRIANADIQFTGSGVISDKQHPGWAMRAFDWVWPF